MTHSGTQSRTRLSLYADGACSGNPGPGGFAWEIYKDTPKPSCEPIISGGLNHLHTTNNVMELLAAQGALSCLLELAVSDCDVAMCLDSEYVLKGLFQWSLAWEKRGWRKSSGYEVANKEIWIALVELKRSLEKRGVKLISSWVRGHDGDIGNERVDKRAVELRDLAKKGISVVKPEQVAAPSDPPLAQTIDFVAGDIAQHRKGGIYVVMRILNLTCDSWADGAMTTLSLPLEEGGTFDIQVMVQTSTPVAAGEVLDWALYMPLKGDLRAFLRPAAEFGDGRFDKIVDQSSAHKNM